MKLFCFFLLFGIAAIAASFDGLRMSAHGEPFDSTLTLSLSPFDVAQGDPERAEGSKGERLAQNRLVEPPTVFDEEWRLK